MSEAYKSGMYTYLHVVFNSTSFHMWLQDYKYMFMNSISSTCTIMNTYLLKSIHIHDDLDVMTCMHSLIS